MGKVRFVQDWESLKGWERLADLGVDGLLWHVTRSSNAILRTGEYMKNVVFWDIKTQFILHRRHITASLQSPASQCYVRSEVFTAVAMKNDVFWDIKRQFLPHRRQITSLLQSTAG
jgi:hypothetical protein